MIINFDMGRKHHTINRQIKEIEIQVSMVCGPIYLDSIFNIWGCFQLPR